MIQPGRFKRALQLTIGGSVAAAFLLLDLVGSGLTGGSWNETISSRLGRAQRGGSHVAYVACLGIEGAERVLRYVASHPDPDPTNHCEEAARATGK